MPDKQGVFTESRSSEKEAVLKMCRSPDVKCVVVGDDSVGKTSMLLGYATQRYPTQYVPSVFDNYAGRLKIGGRNIRLEIIDTIEEEETPSLRQSLYSNTDIFVVCFSVIQPNSLRHVEEVWLPEIKKHAPATPFILAGAQADLRSVEPILTMLSSQGHRPVTASEGEAIARKMGAACYIETSPEIEKQVRKVFNSAVASVLKDRVAETSSCTLL